MNVKKSIPWFTLVELIVIVSILVILWTIWFVSYSSYLSTARDSSRVSQLVSLYDWLEIYSVKNEAPLPSDYIRVQSDATWTVVVWYQWYFWENILDSIDFNKWWLDPKDQTYFTYYVSRDKKSFQLLWYLEENNDNLTSFFPWAHAVWAVDYTERFPVVYGKKLGVMTEDLSNALIWITNY